MTGPTYQGVPIEYVSLYDECGPIEEQKGPRYFWVDIEEQERQQTPVFFAFRDIIREELVRVLAARSEQLRSSA